MASRCDNPLAGAPHRCPTLRAFVYITAKRGNNQLLTQIGPPPIAEQLHPDFRFPGYQHGRAAIAGGFMKVSHFLPLLLAGLAFPAFSMSGQQYDEARKEHMPVVLPAAEGAGLPAGKVFEALGTVKSIADDSFTLEEKSGRALTFTPAEEDADIAEGATLRVLARVAEDGGYRSFAATRDIPVVKPAPVSPTPPAGATPTAARKPAPKPAPKPARPSFAVQLKSYTAKIRQFNSGISAASAEKIAYSVLVKSPRYGLDPRLVFALLAQESRFNPRAVSPAGARGLGQLMPGTAQQLGVTNSFDIYQNVEGTVRYLAAQLKRFNGNVSYALAAYNAGPGNVLRYGGIPPFRETQNYVQTISGHLRKLVNQLL